MEAGKLCHPCHPLPQLRGFGLSLIIGNSPGVGAHRSVTNGRPLLSALVARTYTDHACAFHSARIPAFGPFRLSNMVSLPGIEPGSRQPKSGIIPLDHSDMCYTYVALSLAGHLSIVPPPRSSGCAFSGA